MLTREYIPGRGWVTVDASFRRYASPAESTADWWRLMQRPRYRGVREAGTAEDAFSALSGSGYATDPGYTTKLRALQPQTPEQMAFMNDRLAELQQLGVPQHLADVGWRQAALETGWGRSAPGNNFYGIKMAAAGRPDIEPGPFGMEDQPVPFMPPQPPMPQFEWPQEPAPQQEGLFTQLAGHPLFNMGLGILGANTGHYGAFAPAFGRGAMAGLNQVQQTQFLRQQAEDAAAQRRDRQLREAKIRYDLRKEQAAAQKAQYFRDNILPPHMRAMFDVDPEGTTNLYQKTQEQAGKPGAESAPLPTGYKLDSDLQEMWGLDPKKAFEVQEQRNRETRLDPQEILAAHGQFVKSEPVAIFYGADRAATILPDLYSKATKENSKVADVALITTLAKAMDPGSVVRSGETDTIVHSGGVWDILKSYLNFASNKGPLSPQMRKDVAKAVLSYREAAKTAAERERKYYSGLETRWNVPPGTVVGDPWGPAPEIDFGNAQLPPNAPPPPPGAVPYLGPGRTGGF